MKSVLFCSISIARIFAFETSGICRNIILKSMEILGLQGNGQE